MAERFDAVVAGAGLAGSVAAADLAALGLRVLLAERKDDPGDFNYCAEAVSARAIAPFEIMSPELIAAPIDGGLLVGPGRVQARLLYPGVGYILHRDRLLRRLFERACKQGAHGRLGCELSEVHRDPSGRMVAVSLRSGSSTGRVECSALVAADGVGGAVGRLAGVDTRLAPGELLAAAQYRMSGVDVESGYPEFWIGDEFAPGGYAWVFPRGSGQANVGLGMVVDRPSARGQSATRYLKRFRRERFQETGKIDSYIVGGIPTLLRRPPSAAQGVLLVGDALRAPDPLSAAGIAEAMDSARKGARVLAEALEVGELGGERLSKAGEEYHRAHPRLRAMGLIRRIFDGLDDGEKAELVGACRDAFHGRRLDGIDPIKMFLQLLKARPRLVGYARHLLKK